MKYHSMSFRSFIVFPLLLWLGGCATQIDELAWPEMAYPREYFEAAFEEDELAQQYQTKADYLLWITHFYNGYSIAPGWISLTEQVKERLEEPYRSEVALRLYHLGGRIGSEWAKDNKVRVLDTRNAAVWRDALIESLNQNDLDDYITRVEEDVENMYVGNLSREDIYFERYYEDDFEF